MRIAVCSAERTQLMQVKLFLDEGDALKRKHIKINFYNNERLFLAAAWEEPYSVVFLGYEMTVCNGIMVLELLRSRSPETIVVLGLENLKREFWKICKLYEESYHKYVINSKDGILMVPFDDIRYLESFRHTIRVYTTKEMVEFHSKLNEEEKKVPQWKFVRIHQSYVVNLLHVVRMTSSKVVLDNNYTLKISTSRKQNVQDKMHNFIKWMKDD